MDGADDSATMTSTNASGCGAGAASRAGRPSQFCLIGWLQPGTTAFTAGSSLASGSPPAILPSKLPRSARIQRACPTPPPFADGLSGACSACGAGSRSESQTRTFCRHPPSPPGISARSAVFCRSRQEVRESSISRRVETADSVIGLSAGA
jgi:hypothetical protein